jgi:hypothetical protein
VEGPKSGFNALPSLDKCGSAGLFPWEVRQSAGHDGAQKQHSVRQHLPIESNNVKYTRSNTLDWCTVTAYLIERLFSTTIYIDWCTRSNWIFLRAVLNVNNVAVILLLSALTLKIFPSFILLRPLDVDDMP